MATYEDMSVSLRLFMRGYPFFRYALKPVPCAPLRKPVNGSKIALVTTAGFHLPDQDAFDGSNKMGDPTFREIPNSVDPQDLLESHHSQSFDHAGIQKDRNLAFPLDRFRELQDSGEIGELNHRHFSFMGSVIGPRKLVEETAPEAAGMLKQDGVDVALLTPV